MGWMHQCQEANGRGVGCNAGHQLLAVQFHNRKFCDLVGMHGQVSDVLVHVAMASAAAADDEEDDEEEGEGVTGTGAGEDCD